MTVDVKKALAELEAYRQRRAEMIAQANAGIEIKVECSGGGSHYHVFIPEDEEGCWTKKGWKCDCMAGANRRHCWHKDAAIHQLKEWAKSGSLPDELIVPNEVKKVVRPNA